MHGRICKLSAWMLTVAAAWGLSVPAVGQDGPMQPTSPNSYNSTTDGYRTPPATPPASQNEFVSNNNGQDADLALRVAELEKALQKMHEKAAADKAKAAGKPSVSVGGRIQWDTAGFSQNAQSLSQAGDMLNGTEFRRARLCVKGEAFNVVDYKFQVDFADSPTAFKDVYMTIKELPYVGHIRFGNFYECYGLDTQTSSNYITFMERSVISPAGGIGDRKPGIMVFNWNEAETMTWWLGGYAWQAVNPYDAFPAGTSYDDNGGYALDARATFLPWYDEATEGRGLLHLGMNYTYREIATLKPGTAPTVNRYRIAQRPDAHLANYVVDTSNITTFANADGINAFSPEVAFVYGPFSVQAEYEWAYVHQTGVGTAPFDGGYIFVSYFLTGENRVYERKEGVFGRVKPYENFFRVRTEDCNICTGKGAWELAYRVDYLNLNTLAPGAGRVVNHTFGINWYLSPYTRLMLNYVHSETNGRTVAAALPGTGVADILETRCQVDF